jgi:hypothetical protein
LEAKQAILDLGERGKVTGREDLALDDREINLDLIEPRVAAMVNAQRQSC